MKFNSEAILRFIRRPLEVVVLRYLFSFFILAPVIMYLLWVLSPKHTLEIALVNKSVPDETRKEHASFSWLLKHERVVNGKGEFYQKESDYYGFFPRLGGDFVIRDFSHYDSLEIDSFAQNTDILYLADGYGVYTHDYYSDFSKPNRLMYGGMNQGDVNVLKEMRKQEKLVIAEFSLFGAPTRRSVRDSLETVLGLDWSGWIGRYFISLDSTANDALPHWVIKLYQDEHGPVWPFFDSGVVLVNGSEILVLEYGTHLKGETPYIETQDVYAAEYGLPTSINYPFWFDIVSSPANENQIVSIFHLPVNQVGDSLLTARRIPPRFPAVLRETGGVTPFYYFAGDFSDNPVVSTAAHFKGIEWFQSFFYKKDQVDDRQQFFWRFYRPLMKKILEDQLQGK